MTMILLDIIFVSVAAVTVSAGVTIVILKRLISIRLLCVAVLICVA